METESNNRADSAVTRQEQAISTMPYIALGMVALAVGGVAAILTLSRGQDTMFSMEQEISWGLLIITYAFFMVTASGLAVIGGLGHAFGAKNFQTVSNRIVVMAFVLLLAGFTQIGMDLGHPFRLWIYMLVSPNFNAPITWMGLLYSVELVLLGTELFLIFRAKGAAPEGAAGNGTVKRVLGILTMIVGIVAAGTLGMVFGINRAIPFYFGGFFSLFFIVTGIVSAAALLSLSLNLIYKWRIPDGFEAATRGLGKVMIAGISAMALLYLWKMSFDLGFDGVSGGMPSASGKLAAGSFALNFWLGEIGLAVVLPLILIGLSRLRDKRLLGLAGLFFLTGFFFTKYDAIVAGQLTAGQVDVAGNPLTDPRALGSYFPATGEWLVFILGCGIFLTLYFLTERFFSRQIRAI